MRRLFKWLEDAVEGECFPDPLACVAMVFVAVLAASGTGCSGSHSQPSQTVTMKCVAVHYNSHGVDLIIMEDEGGERIAIKSSISSTRAVVGDEWLVRDGELDMRIVKHVEPEFKTFPEERK